MRGGMQLCFIYKIIRKKVMAKKELLNPRGLNSSKTTNYISTMNQKVQ